MKELDETSEVEEKELEKKLKDLPKEKRKIWRLITFGVVLPFVGPYIPIRKGMLVDRMGFENSFMLFGLISLIFIPICCYIHFQKVNSQISDVECDLEILKRKNN